MGLNVAGLPLEEANRIRATDVCQRLQPSQLAFLFAKYGAYKVPCDAMVLKQVT
jgi:hypothetical protein